MESLERRQRECIKEALELEKRSWPRLLLYTACLFFPPLLGISLLAIIQVYPVETPVIDVKFIQLFIPYLVGLVFVELIVSLLMKWPFFRFNDRYYFSLCSSKLLLTHCFSSVSSLSMGILNRMFKMFMISIGVLPYAFIYNNWCIYRFRTAIDTHNVLLFMYLIQSTANQTIFDHIAMFIFIDFGCTYCGPRSFTRLSTKRVYGRLLVSPRIARI